MCLFTSEIDRSCTFHVETQQESILHGRSADEHFNDDTLVAATKLFVFMATDVFSQNYCVSANSYAA